MDKGGDGQGGGALTEYNTASPPVNDRGRCRLRRGQKHSTFHCIYNLRATGMYRRVTRIKSRPACLNGCPTPAGAMQNPILFKKKNKTSVREGAVAPPGGPCTRRFWGTQGGGGNHVQSLPWGSTRVPEAVLHGSRQPSSMCPHIHFFLLAQTKGELAYPVHQMVLETTSPNQRSGRSSAMMIEQMTAVADATRLATSVCQFRNDRMEPGPTEPHAGRSTFLPSSGGSGGGYY